MKWLSFPFNFPSVLAVLSQGIMLYYNLLEATLQERYVKAFFSVLHLRTVTHFQCHVKWSDRYKQYSSNPNVLDMAQFCFSLAITGLMFWKKKLKKTAEVAATSKINLVTIKIIFNKVPIYKLLFFGWLYTDVDLKKEVRDFHRLDNFMLITNYIDGRNVK